MQPEHKTTITSETRPQVMQPLAHLRFVEMEPQVRVLQQAWVSVHGGRIEWRNVPTVSREEAGYGE